MCERPNHLKYYYSFRQDELPVLNAFLWDEFKILGGCGYCYEVDGWRFDDPNKWNSLISLLIVKSLEAIRKDKKGAKRDFGETTIPKGICRGEYGGAAEDFSDTGLFL